ncbi:MAG: RdgB/HAM1 family non-canonical purine NTP pyrophosphatase [bacterium]|nr:RdgB/HAM1 family non-canonical purine NTP pyrophosphatase [bacterium]
MKILFASSNKNKIREINSLLAGRHTVLGLEEAGITVEIPETGSTLHENSFLKAKFVLEHFGEKSFADAVFADDSGLEVEALNGAPGVFSARYAGIPKNDVSNNIKLLEELKWTTNRKARFVTVITLIINGEVHYFEGEIKGTIAQEPRGKNGFGYDPLFIPRGYRSTFAELSAETKNAISHRAIAVNKMVKFLEKF